MVADGRLVGEGLGRVEARVIDRDDLVLGAERVGDLRGHAAEGRDARRVLDGDLGPLCIGDGDRLLGEARGRHGSEDRCERERGDRWTS